MGETQRTKEVKKALLHYTKAHLLGVYGAFEVTLGRGYGRERVDYMTMDNGNEFKCYEIKVSKSDLNSKAALSFKGDFNYLVVTIELYESMCDDDIIKKYTAQGIGILVACENLLTNKINFSTKHKAKRKGLQLDEKVQLMHYMVRSLSRLTNLAMEM